MQVIFNRKNKFLHSAFVSGDLFGEPAFFQKNRFLGAELMTAHAVYTVGIIKIGDLLSLSNSIGGAIVHADITIGAIAIQNGWANPNKRFNRRKQKLGN
jgi:hypothetical protein